MPYWYSQALYSVRSVQLYIFYNGSATAYGHVTYLWGLNLVFHLLLQREVESKSNSPQCLFLKTVHIIELNTAGLGELQIIKLRNDIQINFDAVFFMSDRVTVINCSCIFGFRYIAQIRR